MCPNYGFNALGGRADTRGLVYLASSGFLVNRFGEINTKVGLHEGKTMPLVVTRAFDPPPGPAAVWITLLGGANSDNFLDIAVDASGNSYVGGYYDAGGTSGTDGLIASFDNTGSLQWQVGYRSNSDPGASSNDRIYGIGYDGGSNVFIGGQRTFQNGVIVQIGTALGNFGWQRELGGGVATPNSAHFTTAANATHVYSGGFYAPGGGASPQLAQIIQYNKTTGAITWIRRLGAATPSLSSQNGFKGMTIDSGGNVYLVGEERQTFSGFKVGLMAKFNVSGGLLNVNSFGGGTDNFDFQDCFLDSSNNLYAIGTVDENTGTGPERAVLVKMDSSLNVLWQRYIGDATNQCRAGGVWVDSSDRIFVSAYSLTGPIGSRDVILAEYNASGTQIWMNDFGEVVGTETGHNIGGDNSGSLYFIANTTSTAGSGGNDGLIARVPDNGSGTGTYGTFIYQTSSIATGTPTYSNGSSSMVLNSPTGSGVTSTVGTYVTTFTEVNI